MKLPSPRHCLAVAGMSMLFCACTSQQLYATGQQWQKTECRKIDDRAERRRCEHSSETRYEDYKAQTDAVRKP